METAMHGLGTGDERLQREEECFLIAVVAGNTHSMRTLSFSFIWELTEDACPGDKLSDPSEQLFWRGEDGWGGYAERFSSVCVGAESHLRHKSFG